MSEKIIIGLGAAVFAVGFATSSMAMTPVDDEYPNGTASAGVMLSDHEQVQRQNAVDARS